MPPISTRQARRSIVAVMLFGPLYLLLLPFLMTLVAAWRGWRLQPLRFWRPFTLMSLILAFATTLGWPLLGGYRLADFLFGESAFRLRYYALTEISFDEQILVFLAYWAASYIVCALVLLPHTVMRFVHALTTARTKVS